MKFVGRITSESLRNATSLAIGRPIPIQAIMAVALLLCASTTCWAGLRIDFTNATGPTQAYYSRVPSTGVTDLVSDIGTVDISLGGAGIIVSSRDRGALDPSQPLSDLARDFIFGRTVEGPSMDITVAGLDAGTYNFTGYFHDNVADQGLMDVEVSVDGGSVFNLVLDDQDFSTGTNPSPLATGAFSFTATGSDDVVFRLSNVFTELSNGNHLINGFDILDVAGETTLNVDANTGALSLATAVSTDILGYSLSSASGALSQAGWTTIASSNIDWTVLSDPSSVTDLSELESTGGALTVVPASPLALSAGGAFLDSPVSRDLVMELILPNGVVEVPIVYSGDAPVLGDFDLDDDVDADDYAIFIGNHLGEFSSLPTYQAYLLGDMNNDLQNDFADLSLFQTAYDDFNSPGSFVAMLASVPEPSSTLLLLLGVASLLLTTRRDEMRSSTLMKNLRYSIAPIAFFALLFSGAGLTSIGNHASAAVITWSEVSVDSTDGDSSPGTGLGDAAVSTNGVLVEAANFGTLIDYTVNGVLFNGIDFTVAPTNLNVAYDSNDNLADGTIGGTSVGTTFDNLTSSFGRNAGVGFQSAALTGLTIGQQYEVQFIASFGGLGRTTTFDDGNGNTIVQSTNDPHSFSMGTFTADAPTQTIDMTISSGSQFLSAYQLREIGAPLEPARVMINTDTGLVTLLGGDSGIDLDYYLMTSDSAALDPAGWISLDQQNYDAVDGDDPGTDAGDSLLEGWDEAGESDSESLAEVFFLDSSSIASDDYLALGHAFTPGESTTGLAFQYNLPDAGLFNLDIETTTGFGDMNGDGAVDENDVNAFVLALTDRAAYEATYPGVDPEIVGDINQDASFNLGDVGPFKGLFSPAVGQSNSVPEPTAITLLLLAAVACVGSTNRRRVN